MKRYLLAVVLCVIALGCWSAGLKLAAERQSASVVVGFSDAPATGTQLFFARKDDFSERDSVILREAVRAWHIQVPADRLDTLRIDPPIGAGAVICSLDFTFADGEARSLQDYRVSGFHQMADIRHEDGCLNLVPLSGSEDPQVMLALSSPLPAHSGPILPVALGIVGVLSLLGAILLVLRSREALSAQPFAERVGGRLVEIYVLISLLAGFAYAVITPPGAVTDEYAHVTKAVKVSSGVLVGSTGDRAFPDVIGMYGVFNGYLDPSVHFSTSQLATQIGKPVPCNPTTAALPAGADSYAPHLYVAPAASYALSCALDLDTGSFLLLARLGNLLLATALIAIGLWSTRRARWALFVCALLPMTVYQVASVSADAMYLALSFAWIGAVCGLVEERIPVGRAMPILLPLALALAVSKPGAAWVLGAILFARPLYLRAMGTFLPTLLKLLVVPFVVHVLWVLYAAGGASPLEGVDPTANLARLRSEPLDVASVFMKTFLGSHGLWLSKSAMGVLGWLDVYLSGWSYLGLSLCLFASLWMGLDARRPAIWVSGIAVIFAAGAAVMLAIPLFIFWTYQSSTYVMGLQGRYFLPCIAFAACFLARGSSQHARSVLSVLVPAAITFALADGLLALIARYYP